MMPWLYLLAAICFEVLGTIFMKLSDGYTKTWFSWGSIMFYVMSFWLLALVLKYIPVGMAYAIWAGLGTAIIVIIGMIFFNEAVSFLRILFMLMIIGGVIGLNMVSKAH